MVKQLIEVIQNYIPEENYDRVNFYGHEICAFEKAEVEFIHKYVKEHFNKELNQEDILYARFQSVGHSDFCNTFAYELSKLLQ